MMKILLLTDHSHASQPLAEISAENHWQYSARHGYDYLVIRREWDVALKEMNKPLLDLFPLYDCIMTFGSDVLFTNFEKRVEDLLIPGDNVILAVEPYDWPSYFNLGVMLMRTTRKSYKFFEDTDAAEPEWRGMRLRNQDWANLHYREYADTLRFVPTRVMNSPYHGIEKWKRGDWLIHFYGEEKKDKLMTSFLRSKL
jgi:hypothetical protein